MSFMAIYEPGLPPPLPPWYPPVCGLGWGGGLPVFFYRQFKKGKPEISVCIQKAFVNHNLKTKGARNTREFCIKRGSEHEPEAL